MIFTRVLSFAALLCPTIARAASNTLTGTWDQVYSNKYVQSTTEMDWKCIKVHAYAQDKQLNIYKVAHLHGGPQVVITPLVTAHLDNDKINIQKNARSSASPVKKDDTFDVHKYSNDTIIITGDDNPALFVWTREGSQEEPIDIPRLMAFAETIGFEVDQDQIVSTYNKTTC